MAMRLNSDHFPSGFSFGNSDKMACPSRVKEAEIARIVRSTCSTMSMLRLFSKEDSSQVFSERGSLVERRLFRLRRRKITQGGQWLLLIKEMA